jgi:hypothetical protein
MRGDLMEIAAAGAREESSMNMPPFVRALAAAGAVMATMSLSAGGPDVLISEVRIDQPGADLDEYFELTGPPGFSLIGLTYIVLGDGAAASGSGLIEAVVPIDGLIAPSGKFVVAEGSFTLGVPDLTANLNFENSDNVTHLLVTGFSGADATDLDTDNDGSLDLTPWTAVVDAVGLIVEPNPPAATEFAYGAALGFVDVGPDGVFVPGHVYRYEGDCTDWQIGGFDLGVNDSPGAANPSCPPPPQFLTAFGLAHMSLGQAGLALEPDGLHLTNIGSSGEDGVAIELGTAQGWAGSIDFGQAGALELGSRTVLKSTFQTGDVPTESQLVIEEASGGMAALSFTRSDPCNPCELSVDLLLDGEVVDSMSYLPPYPPALAVGNIGSQGSDHVGVKFAGSETAGAGSQRWHVDCTGPTLLTLTDSPNGPVNADSVRVSLNGLPPGIRYKGTLAITSADLPQLTISSESLVHLDAQHSAIGAATIMGLVDADELPSLHVGNIGSSGQDGVEICCGDVDGDGLADITGGLSVDATLAAAQGRDVYVWKIKGKLASSTGDIGQITLQEIQGGQRAIIVDQPPLLTNVSLKLGVANGGVEIASVENDAPGTIGIIQSGQMPVSYDFQLLSNGPGSAVTMRHTLLWDTAVDLGIADLPVLSGDQLTIETTGEISGGASGVWDSHVTSTEILVAAEAGTVGEMTVHGVSYLPPPAPSFTGFGLHHSVLGQAQVTPGEIIEITNIGSSGEDGVLITLGAAEGWAGEIDFGPAGSLSLESRVILKTFFETGDIPNESQLTIEEVDGGAASISLARGVCDPCRGVIQALLNGNVVDSVPIDTLPAGEIARGNIGSSGQDGVQLRYSLTKLDGDSEADFTILLTNPVPTQLELTGSSMGSIEADALRISLNGLPPGKKIYDTVALTAANLPSLIIADEALVQHRVEHRVDSQVMTLVGALDGDGHPDVVVSGISLEGGSVLIGFDQTDSNFDGAIDQVIGHDMRIVLNPDFPIYGITNEPLAVMADGSEGPLGYSGFAIPACGCSYYYVVTDPPSDPNPTKVITASLNGKIVATASPPGFNMFDGSLKNPPDSWSTELLESEGADQYSYRVVWKWDEPVGLVVSGKPVDAADTVEIVVSAIAGPAGAPLRLVQSTLMSSGSHAVPASLRIDDQSLLTTATPPLCPADLSGDETVGPADLAQLLATWGDCEPGVACPADFNDDGEVGPADLAQLLATWGPCQ